jgi:hypothetical protein
VDWQEVVHSAENGIKHIADVKTDHGWAIEFQHSAIKPKERRSREAFYGKLVWVVDGLRRQRDKLRFAKAWEDGMRIGSRHDLKMLWRYDGALLREWADSQGQSFLTSARSKHCGGLMPPQRRLGLRRAIPARAFHRTPSHR